MSTGYRTQSPDTSREAEEFQFAHWRGMTPAQKGLVLTNLMAMAEELARAGIRMRHPGAGAEEIEMRLRALILDRETMVKFFGWDPEREGY
jgi:hypothetical protein